MCTSCSSKCGCYHIVIAALLLQSLRVVRAGRSKRSRGCSSGGSSTSSGCCCCRIGQTEIRVGIVVQT